MQNFRIISNVRCTIGEGPIWNAAESRLYQVNGFENEILKIELPSATVERLKLPMSVAAIAFDRQYRPLLSTPEGVFRMSAEMAFEPLYDRAEYTIACANDMKVGPDGSLYVGTQSGKRAGISDKVDGKLYRIDRDGEVAVLLDGLILSNGLDWSCDGKRFYHTDSDTGWIREYDFDDGRISFTGRQVYVPGVDGFTVDQSDRILAACWGHSHLAIIDTASMAVVDHIAVPARIPASCGFAGERMNLLAVVTATYGTDIRSDEQAGFTFLRPCEIGGKLPYLFG